MLVASLYVYKMMVIESMTAADLAKFNSIIQQFIWNGHRPKISLKELQLNKCEGGLSLVDMAVRDKSLKATWPGILQQNQRLQPLVSGA